MHRNISSHGTPTRLKVSSRRTVTRKPRNPTPWKHGSSKRHWGGWWGRHHEGAYLAAEIPPFDQAKQNRHPFYYVAIEPISRAIRRLYFEPCRTADRAVGGFPMNQRADIPRQLIAIDQQAFMKMMQDIAEIKLALTRATIQPAPEWVLVPDAAKELRLTPGTIRRKIASGELPSKGTGKGRLVKIPR